MYQAADSLFGFNCLQYVHILSVAFIHLGKSCLHTETLQGFRQGYFPTLSGDAREKSKAVTPHPWAMCALCVYPALCVLLVVNSF